MAGRGGAGQPRPAIRARRCTQFPDPPHWRLRRMALNCPRRVWRSAEARETARPPRRSARTARLGSPRRGAPSGQECRVGGHLVVSVSTRTARGQACFSLRPAAGSPDASQFSNSAATRHVTAVTLNAPDFAAALPRSIFLVDQRRQFLQQILRARLRAALLKRDVALRVEQRDHRGVVEPALPVGAIADVERRR